MKTKILLTAIITATILIYITSCRKLDHITKNNIEEVNILSAKSAEAEVDAFDLSPSEHKQHGVCYSKDKAEPTIADNKIELGELTEPTKSIAKINNLLPNTKYYFRGYVMNDSEAIYSFTTIEATTPALPDAITLDATEITNISAKLNASINANGGQTNFVFEYGETTAYGNTTNIETIATSTQTNIFAEITNLTPEETYNYRVKATTSTDTVYGENKSFTTIATSTATLSTTAITNITETTATSGGNITHNGGATITARGVCWSTSQNPTIADSKTTDGAETGVFTSSITSLEMGTTYYVRAYAINSAGTSYGNQQTLTSGTLAPTLTTTSITNITTTTATSGGNITNDGGASIIARGVCWNTSQNPTTTDDKTTDGTGTGSFISNITNITHATTYYVRSYATNSVGTSYGNEVSFTTEPETPSLTTVNITNIATTTATSGGNITDNGGATITARGVCWSTSQNPTTADDKTTDGNGTGSFTSNITGLNMGVTYYVRAYATNSVGTSYGNQQTFTSGTIAPTLTTSTITNITSTTATSGGNITSNGGASITARGVCWSTSQNPTTANSKTTDGTGTGSFTSNLTSLIANTLYYVRAYATNSAGTSYGNQQSFTTFDFPNCGTVTDYDGNTYNTVSIGNQCWITENLKVTHYPNGDAIPLVTDNTTWADLADDNTSDAMSYYNNNASSEADTYGALYTYAAAIGDDWTRDNTANQGICPDGWHLPSDDEWTALTDFLGGTSVAGGKMKEAGTTHWNSPNTGADNTSGFSALPGGYRNVSNGTFFNLGSYGYWWSSTENSGTNAWYRALHFTNAEAHRDFNNKSYGFGVRCLRD